MKRIYFLLDETGSMGAVTEQSIAGFNQYVKDQVGPRGVRMSLITFNSLAIKTQFSDTKPKDVKPLTLADYRPDHTTPLYDAMLYAIDLAKSEQQAKDEVVIVVLTDGQENASVKCRDLRTVSDAIIERQKAGWLFVYMGANQDAWAVGGSLGIPKGMTLTYDAARPEEAFRQASIGTRAYLSGNEAVTTNFFRDDHLDPNQTVVRTPKVSTVTSKSTAKNINLAGTGVSSKSST